jgi:POT family proton-dependent oligopeptide transporter
MALHGTPNDLLQNLDPIALIIFIPFLDLVVYPGLRKMKIDFDPISRIFAGFLLVSISMVYASVLQHYIYNSPEKSIHVWIQAPAYILVAFSEAFIIITGLELAFTQAPAKYVVPLPPFLSSQCVLMIYFLVSAPSSQPYSGSPLALQQQYALR